MIHQKVDRIAVGTRFEMSVVGAARCPELAGRRGIVIDVSPRTTGITVLFDGARRATCLHTHLRWADRRAFHRFRRMRAHDVLAAELLFGLGQQTTPGNRAARRTQRSPAFSLLHSGRDCQENAAVIPDDNCDGARTSSKSKIAYGLAEGNHGHPVSCNNAVHFLAELVDSDPFRFMIVEMKTRHSALS